MRHQRGWQVYPDKTTRSSGRGRFWLRSLAPGATPRGTRIDPERFAVGFLGILRTLLLWQQNTKIVVRVCILRTDPERFAVREGFD
jgi:hypothetical protein